MLKKSRRKVTYNQFLGRKKLVKFIDDTDENCSNIKSNICKMDRFIRQKDKLASGYTC